MIFGFFVKGLIIGLSIAAPIGPSAVLCLRRALANSFLSGFVSGLGTATACTFYGAVAVFGLTIISDALLGTQFWIRLIGGVFLIYLGVKTFRAEPQMKGGAAHKATLKSDYISAFLLTITSPMTIILFAAMCSGLDFSKSGSIFLPGVLMVAGITIGGIAWWFCFTGLASLLRRKFTYKMLKKVNQLSGIVIIGFAIIAFLAVLRH